MNWVVEEVTSCAIHGRRSNSSVSNPITWWWWGGVMRTAGIVRKSFNLIELGLGLGSETDEEIDVR